VSAASQNGDRDDGFGFGRKNVRRKSDGEWQGTMDPMDGVSKDPEFRKLQKEWYKKLKASGFNDVEAHESERDHFMTEHHLMMSGRQQRGVVTGEAEFYRLAAQWLHIDRWPTRRDRIHFAAWAEGATFQSTVTDHLVPSKRGYDSQRIHHNRRLATMLGHFGEEVELNEADALQEVEL
jgi:hypothetical protein